MSIKEMKTINVLNYNENIGFELIKIANKEEN